MRHRDELECLLTDILIYGVGALSLVLGAVIAWAFIMGG